MTFIRVIRIFYVIDLFLFPKIYKKPAIPVRKNILTDYDLPTPLNQRDSHVAGKSPVDICHPFIIWKLGILNGGLAMTILSFVVCYATLLFYDWSKKDWLGIVLKYKSQKK